MRGGLEASRPRASPATDVTGHSTEVLDVDAAPNSEILAGFLAEYGSGSEDADPSRLLLVCDNASVHKADELKKLMDQYGIIFRFLPPNMTQWLQPLDRVVCGLIKILQRARRGLDQPPFATKWSRQIIIHHSVA
jgi:hypothetical protein